ncbi:unnamed protein product [Cochlearia groenlandica]
MESKAVVIQEPVSTKIHVKEDLEGVVLDHTSMEVDKRLLSSTFLDDDITSRNRKTDILPKDAKIVNDSGNQESEDEKYELECLNTKKEDEKAISSDVVLKKEKEEEEAYEETPIKNDEVKDSRNSENIVNETTIEEEEETATNGESKHDTETSKSDLIEADKEVERKIDAEPSLNPIKEVETETLKTVIEDSKIVNNEETIVNEPVEAIKNSGDAEKISNEVQEEEGQEAKEDAENILGLKEDKETEETEKVKTESHGRQEYVELKEKVQDDITEEEKHESLLHVQSTETDKYRDNREIPETYEEVDVTQTMEEHRALDSNEPETEQIGQNRTDETEKNITEKLVALPDEHMEKLSLESPSQVSEETSKTVDEKIEEVTLQQEGQVSLANVQEKEKMLLQEQTDKQAPTSEQVIKGETVVEAEKIEKVKASEEEEEDKIKKSLEEYKEHETVCEKTTEEKAIEEEPMVQTKSQERQDDISKAVETGETKVVQEEQPREIVTSLTEKCNVDQPHRDEQVKEASSKNDAKEETATNGGESLHDVDTTKRALEAEKQEDIIVSLPDVESVAHMEKPSLESPSQVSGETSNTVDEKIEDIEVNKEEKIKKSLETVEEKEHVETDETTVVQEDQTREISSLQESESFKMQESPRVIETPILQEEETESKASIELKEDVDQSSKATEEHVHVLERDITDCETLETETIDTSTVQETKEDKETSLNLKEDKNQKKEETVKSVILTNEVRSSHQDNAQEEELGELCSSEIKDESQGREVSVEIKSKENVKDESAEKDENLLDVQSGESEKYQDNKQEEGSYVLDTKQETVLVQDSSELVDKAKEEDSYPLIEEEKHEPTKEEVLHAQQSLVEEKSDEVIQVLSALPSEESEGETIAESEKIKDIKGNEEEQVADKIHTSLESFEVAETQSSLPLSSDEKEHEKIAEAKKTEDEEVTEAEPKGDMSEKGLEIANKVDEETTMGLDSSYASKPLENVCTNQEEYENLEAPKLEESKQVKSQEIPATTKATKSTNDQTLPIETIQSEQSTLSELVPRKGVEILEEEAKEAHKLQEEEIIPTETAQEEEKRKETIETSKATEAKSDQTLEETHGEETKESHKLPEEPRGLEFNDQDITDEGEESLVEKLVGVEEDGLDKTTNNQTLVGAESSKKIHKPSLESPCEISEETSKTVDEKIEEVTPDQESSYGSDTKQSCLLREEERETKLPIEQIEKHEEEQVADKIHTSVGSFEITEPHSSLPSSSDEQKHVTVAETNKTEDKEVTEAEPMGYISEKGLEIASKVDEEITVDLDSSCASKTSKLVCTNQEASKVEESEEDKSQELSEATKAIKSTNDQSLTLKTIQAEQTRSSEIVSEQDDQIPNKFVEIHEEETKNEDDQIPKKVEEIHEVETKEEAQKLQEEEIFPTETVLLQEEKGKKITENVEAMEAAGDQIPKKVEETHEEEIKEEPQMLQEEEEDILTKSVQKESVNEVLVSMLLASGEHEPVTPKDDTNETLEEEHVSAETEPETEPRESGDFLSASSSLLSSETDIQEPETKSTKVQDETNQEEESKEDKSQEVLETKKAIKVREIHGDESISTEPKGDRTEAKLTKVEDETSIEHGDESISTLPVVDILKGLQTTLESERAINDLKSPGESVTMEPTESDVETESNEKVSAAEEIIEANMLQQNEREETKKIQEENGLTGIILPIEVLNLKEEEDKEDLKVQDSISREFVQVEEEEEAKEIAEKKQEESEAQQDASHETIKEEDQINNIKEVKKSEDVQDEKLGGISATRENEEKLTSEVKKDQEDNESELREEAPKDHREEVIADKSLTKEAPVKQIHISSVELSNENVQVQDQSKDYEASVTDEDTYTQEKKSNDEQEETKEPSSNETLKTIKEEEEAKETSRKSLSDHNEKVKGTSKSVEAETTETRIEEKTKTKEEEEEEEDKTSSDSLVMVKEAKDSTVSIIKTQPKKSQGILSGVGSKVKHSISKVKKVLTGKSSSHTTKPTSPK